MCLKPVIWNSRFFSYCMHAHWLNSRLAYYGACYIMPSTYWKFIENRFFYMTVSEPSFKSQNIIPFETIKLWYTININPYLLIFLISISIIHQIQSTQQLSHNGLQSWALFPLFNFSVWAWLISSWHECLPKISSSMNLSINSILQHTDPNVSYELHVHSYLCLFKFPLPQLKDHTCYPQSCIEYLQNTVE